jgi:hypothetical protein
VGAAFHSDIFVAVDLAMSPDSPDDDDVLFGTVEQMTVPYKADVCHHL